METVLQIIMVKLDLYEVTLTPCFPKFYCYDD